jgi:hypothetical protein
MTALSQNVTYFRFRIAPCTALAPKNFNVYYHVTD